MFYKKLILSLFNVNVGSSTFVINFQIILIFRLLCVGNNHRFGEKFLFLIVLNILSVTERHTNGCSNKIYLDEVKKIQLSLSATTCGVVKKPLSRTVLNFLFKTFKITVPVTCDSKESKSHPKAIDSTKLGCFKPLLHLFQCVKRAV